MKLRLLCTGFLITTGLLAQQKTGVVIYERKQHLHRNVNEEMRAMIPEYRINKQMLLFTDQQSLYKAVPIDEAPDPFNTRTGSSIKLGGGNQETYFIFGQNKKLTAAELFGDAYLIKDTIKIQKWSLLGETKTIAGFLCRKAITTIKSFRQSVRIMDGGSLSGQQTPPVPKQVDTEVVAWYAEALQSPAGPESYLGLPGVILELDVDKGAITFLATAVQPLNDLSLIKEPKKGKKVTQEEYNNEMKRMMENMGSGSIQLRSGL